MKKSIDKNIQEAFLKWDEKPNLIGFNKDILWDKVQSEMPTKKKSFPFMQVAAVAIILLLSGGLAFTIHTNNQLEAHNDLLLSELQKKNETVRNPIAKKEVEIKYKTEIKEVVSPEAKALIAHLKQEIANIRDENTALHQANYNGELSNLELQDSISSLLNSRSELEDFYMKQLAEIKSKMESSQLSIDIDEEALMALSKNTGSTQKNKRKKFQIKLKRNRKVTESSAPIFNDNSLR